MNRLVWTTALLSLAAAGCAGRAYVRGTARATVVASPPPEPVVVYDPGPAPQQGAIWVEGHHEWDGGAYVWIDGYWIEPQQDCAFIQPRWVRRGSGYVYEEGGWMKAQSCCGSIQ